MTSSDKSEVIFIPRLAIFDLDGTLIHFEHDYVFTKAKEILPQLGYPDITAQDLERRFADNRMFDFVPDNERTVFAIKFWNHFKHSENPPTRILDGAAETLAKLADKHMTIAIATARSELPDEFKQELKALGILKFVSHISVRNRADTNWTDKREQLAEVCKQSQHEPQYAFMAGDMPEDIRAAHAAKLGHSIALLSSGVRAATLEVEKPHVILQSIKELPEYLTNALVTPAKFLGSRPHGAA